MHGWVCQVINWWKKKKNRCNHLTDHARNVLWTYYHSFLHNIPYKAVTSHVKMHFTHNFISSCYFQHWKWMKILEMGRVTTVSVIHYLRELYKSKVLIYLEICSQILSDRIVPTATLHHLDPSSLVFRNQVISLYKQWI